MPKAIDSNELVAGDEFLVLTARLARLTKSGGYWIARSSRAMTASL
jgi:hypothetical protein